MWGIDSKLNFANAKALVADATKMQALADAN